MSNLNSKKNRNIADEQIVEHLDGDRDMLAEELLHNINTTPIGRLLKKIAAMPEIRQEKVADMRKRINQGDYDLNERFDLALDRVLEELIT